MQFSERWLRSYCNPSWTTEELAHALTMAGLEVEETRPVAPPFSGVKVGKVVALAPHPNADRLRVCQVDTGAEVLSTIVCGAPNVTVGMLAPCALPGAQLPGNVSIGLAKMRGVESAGMLCSARELGLSEDQSGLLELDAGLEPGQDLRAALDLDDTIFVLKLTPNRPDCLGVLGIAREVAALSGAPLAVPSREPVAVTLKEVVPVQVMAPDLCGRFSGRVIRGVDARAKTPAWMRQRLERAGQRSISALVDISNYVMLELSRPSHVFDLDRLQGALQVRWAKAGETLELLNGQTVELAPDIGVIADDSQVESLAGIMGGNPTAVSLSTTNIYLEAAFWWPQAIAGRARRFNFSTDAGHRFERGVDASTTVDHLDYISALITEVCGGQVGPISDTVLELPRRDEVRMRVARAQRLIGVQISSAEMMQCFDRLQLDARLVELPEPTVLVTPPASRFDLQLEEDLVEEVARLWGFERLPLRAPRAPASMMAWPEATRTVSQLKRQLVERDFQEVINYSFVEDMLDRKLGGLDPVKVLNPIASQMNVMRSHLFGGLVRNLQTNLSRKASRVRLFEIGKVFHRAPQQPSGPLQVKGLAQPERLGLLAFGPSTEEQWGTSVRAVDFFDMKGDLEALGFVDATFKRTQHPALHPGRSAEITRAGQVLGVVGELHPALVAELDLPGAPIIAEVDVTALMKREVPQVRPLSNFPPVQRDLAVVVTDAVPAGDVLESLWRTVASDPALAFVTNIRLFDEYRGKGLENKEKSLAFRFWMQDTQRTLDDVTVARALERFTEVLREVHGARLRT
jgi:phenylalanyl-tRNA synthetase beta chain